MHCLLELTCDIAADSGEEHRQEDRDTDGAPNLPEEGGRTRGHADRLEHYQDDDTSIVFEPRFQYLENRRISATARRARVDKQGDHVLLEGDVEIVRPGEKPGTPDTVATTTRLHVMPDEEKAHTDVPVTIRQGQSIINGQGGITIDNKSQITVLLGPATATIYRKPQ